jgi:hypothetical protein
MSEFVLHPDARRDLIGNLSPLTIPALPAVFFTKSTKQSAPALGHLAKTVRPRPPDRAQ